MVMERIATSNLTLIKIFASEIYESQDDQLSTKKKKAI